MKRGKTRSREETAKANVLLAKSNGYERGTPTQRIDGGVSHDFDPHVIKMQDGVLRIFLE
jgi:hypothetical protein